MNSSAQHATELRPQVSLSLHLFTACLPAISAAPLAKRNRYMCPYMVRKQKPLVSNHKCLHAEHHLQLQIFYWLSRSKESPSSPQEVKDCSWLPGFFLETLAIANSMKASCVRKCMELPESCFTCDGKKSKLFSTLAIFDCGKMGESPNILQPRAPKCSLAVAKRQVV